MTVFKVSQPVGWTVLGTGDRPPSVPSVMKWTSEDPLAIEIIFEQATGEISWMFSRDLFADVLAGRCTDAGDGDVHVAKSSSGDSLILTLAVSHVINLKADDLKEVDFFMQNTFAYCPYGEEEIDIDTAIGKLLGGGWASGV